MGLPASISGATSGNLPLLSKRQIAFAKAQLGKQLNKQFTQPAATAPIGADTVFAGSPGVLISLGGADTLGSQPVVIALPKARHGHTTRFGKPGADTLAGAGNQSLTGAASGSTDSTAGASQGIPTVFGGAGPASVLSFAPPPQAAQSAAAVVSVPGAAPDLLLGWSFAAPGYTLQFGGGHGRHGATQLRDGTDIRFADASRQGAVEIIFPKQG